MIPILIAHDHKSCVGRVSMRNQKLIVDFDRDANITKEIFFDIFSGAGARILGSELKDDQVYILQAEILEFSYCPTIASVGK